jgi:hypothetical protein
MPALECSKESVMLILAKMALGMCATAAVAGAYVFHEGVIRVDVDELREGGSHIHFWVPATTVEWGMHIAPRREMRKAAEQVRPYLLVMREVTKELRKYPDAVLVEVTDAEEHVKVSTVGGKLMIDVVDPDETVHIKVPGRTLEDVVDGLEEARF